METAQHGHEASAEEDGAGETSSLYNEYASDRAVHPRAQGLIKWWHRAMALHFERVRGPLEGKAVLEIGHGHGFFADVVRERGGRYLGLEMNGALAEAGRRRGLEVDVGRIPPLPERLRGQFDVVWMSHVLEHARDWMEAHAMAEAARAALRPGGAFCVIVPDYMAWGIEFWNGDWSHGFPTTPRRCVQLLRDVGFTDVQYDAHRGGRFDLPGRTIAATVARLAPFRLFDRLPMLKRDVPDTGFGYSYMSVFGWKQIFISGRR